MFNLANALRVPMLVAAVLGLVACGGGSTTTPSRRSPAASASPTSQVPCDILSRHDVAVAFGNAASVPTSALRAVAASGGGCEYSLGPQTLAVDIVAAPAALRAEIRAAAAHPPTGVTPVREAGYAGVANDNIPTTVATGAEASGNVVVGAERISILFTNTARTHGSLVPRLVVLLRAAAARLPTLTTPPA
jgi:hypothetical protein